MVAAMADTTGAIDAVVAHVESTAGTSEAARAMRRWVSLVPELEGWAGPADLAEAIRRGRPDVQDGLIGQLISVADRDQLAQLTVVAGLAERLGWRVERWRPHVSVCELADMECDLVSECCTAVAALAALAGLGGPVPARVGLVLAQRAHERVRVARRRRRRSEERWLPLDHTDTLAAVPNPSAGEELAGYLSEEVTAGRLPVSSARLVLATRVDGWSDREVAAQWGTTPGTVRSARSRIERRLVAAASVAA